MTALYRAVYIRKDGVLAVRKLTYSSVSTQAALDHAERMRLAGENPPIVKFHRNAPVQLVLVVQNQEV